MIRFLRLHGHLIGVEVMGHRFESRTLRVNAHLPVGCLDGEGRE
jgi:hypothetical protein